VVLISTLMQTALALIPAMLVWQPPAAIHWAVFVGMGLVGMLGHVTLARALRAADASIVLPVEFARLPFAVLLGYLLFDELIDIWTAIGGGIIFTAFVWSAWHERHAEKEQEATA
jgi:drug/metabolite transporter (DMT)-like permease